MKSKVKRTYDIVLYYTDSPTPEYIDNVEHFQTEGGLLRLIISGKSKWIPLINVAYFTERHKTESL